MQNARTAQLFFDNNMHMLRNSTFSYKLVGWSYTESTSSCCELTLTCGQNHVVKAQGRTETVDHFIENTF